MDIVDKLRSWERGACMRPELYDDAADAIERLRDENELLRVWIVTVATDDQLDAVVPALQGATGRDLLAAIAAGGG